MIWVGFAPHCSCAENLVLDMRVVRGGGPVRGGCPVQGG
jgi:hypothetical protein